MRLLFFVAAACLSTACSPGAGPDAGAPDGGDVTTDAGDADGDAGATRDAGSSDAACTFNSDCPANERCECDLDTGCACRQGTRGAGQSGVDTCVDGNDCETSLCVEGPAGAYYCSGPCSDANDCTGALPVCADIALVGRICIRETP